MKKNRNKFLFLFSLLFICGFIFTSTKFAGGEEVFADSSVIPVTSWSSITANGDFVLNDDIEVTQPLDLVFSGTLDGKNKTITSKGVNLFTSLNGATIKNVTIVFIPSENTSVSSSLGIIAPSAENSLIEEISLNIESTKDFEISVEGSSNIGFMFGSISYGTEIKNCEIKNNHKTIVTQTSHNAISTSVGAVSGKVDNSSIKNVIVSAPLELNIIADSDENFSTELNLGGITGYLEGKKSTIINTVSNCQLSSNWLYKEVATTPDPDDPDAPGEPSVSAPSMSIAGGLTDYEWHANTKINKGAFIGKIADDVSLVPDVTSGGIISKLVSCSSEQVAVGKSLSYSLSDTEYLLNKSTNDFSTKSAYQNYSNLVSEWDFNKIWKENDSSLISLQRFSSYKLTVNNSVNSYGLNTATKPIAPALNIELDGGVDDGKGGMDFSYSAVPTVTATFASIGSTGVSYNFFFDIGRLMLNGNLVSSSYEEKQDGKVTKYVWTLDGVTLASQGEYTIELVPRVYSIKVQSEDASKGKVRNYLVANDSFDLPNISYGGTYTVYSVADRYFASDGWKIGEENIEKAKMLSNTTLTFDFSDSDEFTTEYLISREIDADGDLAKLDAKFTASFITVDFLVKIDDKVVNDTTNVVIKVNDEKLSVDSEGNIQIKVTLGTISVSIENLPNSEEFEYILEGHSNSEATSFNFTPEEGETSGTRQFVIKLTSKEKQESKAWIWWLVGAGGLLVVGGIVLTIVLVRKNKDYSYRKMY